VKWKAVIPTTIPIVLDNTPITREREVDEVVSEVEEEASHIHDNLAQALQLENGVLEIPHPIP
jgi:hypothetical protein